MSSMPRSFDCLQIRNLDLSKEHQSILSAAKCLSIRTIILDDCATWSVAQLGRFVTSFPLLRNMSFFIELESPTGFQYTKGLRSCSKSSLKYLYLTLVPNISALCDYFINAGSFVTHLESLGIMWRYVEDVDQYTTLFRGLNELLHHCSKSLQELTMIVHGAEHQTIPDQILDLSERLTHSHISDDGLMHLNSFVIVIVQTEKI